MMKTGIPGVHPLEKNNNFLYYGLLFYTVLYYSQIAARFPVLANFRLEFIVGLLLVLYIGLKLMSGEIDFKENKMNLAAFLFLFVAFLTIPFALVKSRALIVFIRLFKFFAIYLMIVAAVDSENKLKGFLFVYLSMVTLLFIEPFFLSLKGEGFIYNNHMMRLAGITNFFKHPNGLGGMTAANLPFFYYLMKYEKSKKGKILYLTLILISLRVIMLTQSRTAFVGVITFGILIWLFSKRKVLSLFMIMLSCVIIWQFAPQETKNRFLTLRNATAVVTGNMGHEEAGSMYSRWVLIERGFIAFKENPVLGLGLNCFISFNGMRYGYWFPPHNTYIQALAEMGLLGFVAFSFVIIQTFRNLRESIRIRKLMKEENSFISYMTTALTVYLFVRIVVSMFGQDLYFNYWWLAGGLSLVLVRISSRKYENYCRQINCKTSSKSMNQKFSNCLTV